MKRLENKTDKMLLLEYQNGSDIETLLYKYYILDGLSIADTAKKLGIAKQTCQDWLKMVGIDRRPKFEKMLNLRGIDNISKEVIKSEQKS